MQFDVETTTEVPGAGPLENLTMELDIATAGPAPDPLAFGPLTASTGTSENQTMGLDIAAARLAPNPLVTSAGPSKNPIDPEPDTLTIPAMLNDHVIESSQNPTISTDLVSPPQDLPVTTPPSQSMKPL